MANYNGLGNKDIAVRWLELLFSSTTRAAAHEKLALSHFFKCTLKCL